MRGAQIKLGFSAAVQTGSRTSYFVFPKMLVLGKQINVCVSHMSTVLKDKLGVGPLRTYTVPCKFFFIEFLKQNQGLKIKNKNLSEETDMSVSFLTILRRSISSPFSNKDP